MDLAILADGFAPTASLVDALLAGWLNQPPDAALLARFDDVRRLTRLYYGCSLVDAAGSRCGLQLSAAPPPPAEIVEAVAARRVRKGSPQAALLLGKTYLEGFLTGELPAGLREAVEPLA